MSGCIGSWTIFSQHWILFSWLSLSLAIQSLCSPPVVTRRALSLVVTWGNSGIWLHCSSWLRGVSVLAPISPFIMFRSTGLALLKFGVRFSRPCKQETQCAGSCSKSRGSGLGFFVGFFWCFFILSQTANWDCLYFTILLLLLWAA